MSYVPHPHTIAARAVEHLQGLDQGQRLTTAQLAEAIRAESSKLIPCLVSAVEHGLIVREQDIERPTRILWSAPSVVARERAGPKQQPEVVMPIVEEGGQKVVRGVDTAPVVAHPPEDQSIPEPRFAIWSDGRLEMRLCEGMEFKLTRDETAALVAYLDLVGLESLRVCD